jgi:hypothetical protein
MKQDERAKLGEPLMMLIGCCRAAEYLTSESNLKAYSETLMLRAANMLMAWNETNHPGVQSSGEQND